MGTRTVSPGLGAVSTPGAGAATLALGPGLSRSFASRGSLGREYEVLVLAGPLYWLSLYLYIKQSL